MVILQLSAVAKRTGKAIRFMVKKTNWISDR
jgi:hypothetical protein